MSQDVCMLSSLMTAVSCICRLHGHGEWTPFVTMVSAHRVSLHCHGTQRLCSTQVCGNLLCCRAVLLWLLLPLLFAASLSPAAAGFSCRAA